MLAIVWVVQIGSMTRTSACMTARSTFSWADAEKGRARAKRPAKIRYIIHRVCEARRVLVQSEDQAARFGVRVERPDRALDLGVRHLCRVAFQRAAGIDIDYLLGDRPVGRHEMVGRLHHHDLLLRRIDAEIAEQLETGGLGALGYQDDIDTANPHR